VVFQLEADGGFKVLELARPDLDVESVALVGDLDDLGPGKPVDPQPIPSNIPVIKDDLLQSHYHLLWSIPVLSNLFYKRTGELRGENETNFIL
jgi:hypothetical protein